MDAQQIEQEILQNSDAAFEHSIASMSPFERKNLLLSYAKQGDKQHTRTLLDAGRGNPNWISTLPREAFFLLGTFAIAESRRTMDMPQFDLAGMPQQQGSAQRLRAFLNDYTHPDNSNTQAAAFLNDCLSYAQVQGIDLDSLVMEWTQGIIGCEYPVPVRMLEHAQTLVGKYLVKSICDGKEPAQPFDLFATEGGTAAMCYIFNSLMENKLLHKGDTIALMTPIFTPYINIPALNDFDFNVITINATTTNDEGEHTWQFPQEEINKLADPKVKLLCIVNPSNPPSYALDQQSTQAIKQIVASSNPQLMIITDDVYGTFVPNYRSLFSTIPYNTASVYSFSKYFGATGWRLATIAICQHNVFDDLIAQLNATQEEELEARYASLTNDIAHEKFIDRMVADSRLVALNGTAGLSTPQQVQMTLFALYSLLDTMDVYKNRMHQLIEHRLHTLWSSLGFQLPPDPLRAGYYSIIDLTVWARKLYGDAFAQWLVNHYESSDIVLRMAKDTGIILMDGTGFDAPQWSVRVSLANLDVPDYETIGKHLIEMFDDYAQAFKNSEEQTKNDA